MNKKISKNYHNNSYKNIKIYCSCFSSISFFNLSIPLSSSTILCFNCLFSVLSLLFCAITSFSPALDDLRFAFIYSVGNFGLSVSSYKLFITSIKLSTIPTLSKYLVNSSFGYIFNFDYFIICYFFIFFICHFIYKIFFLCFFYYSNNFDI